MRRSHLNPHNHRMRRKACHKDGTVIGSDLMVTGSGLMTIGRGLMARDVRMDSAAAEARAMGAGWGRRYSTCSMRITMA
jgi:hypothetical protein